MKSINLSILDPKIIFLLSHLAFIPVGYLYRTYLSPFKVSANVRHCSGAALGLLLLFILFKWSTLHVVFLTLIVYGILRLLPYTTSHVICCIVTLGYNALIMYVVSLDDRASYTINYALMLAIQKLTILAFSLHDGLARKEEELNTWQRRHMLSKIPSLIEIFGYVFYFGGVFFGPGFFFQDYKDFIDGTNLSNIRKSSSEKEENNNKDLSQKKCQDQTLSLNEIERSTPSPLVPVMIKGFIGALSLIIYSLGEFYLPPKEVTDINFMKSHWLPSRSFWVLLSHFCHLYRVDIIFKLVSCALLTIGEMIQNSSGFGLQLVNGKLDWNLTTSMNIIRARTSTNMKDAIKHWNIFGSKWLRYCFYERGGKYGLHLAFAVSSIWHGIDPGFAIAFHIFYMAAIVGKRVRRSIRPYFLHTKFKLLYDIITWTATQMILHYAAIAFYLLDGVAIFRFYSYSMYWWGHIALLLMIIIPLPDLARYKRNE